MLKLIKGEHVKDGAGVSLNRVIGTSTLDHADPFLLLDEFRGNKREDYIAGFPMHPHRGFETITYMVEGVFNHKDTKGNSGTLKAGEVQWMTAGSGLMHEEMSAMEDGQLWGYQLWINLPKKLKLVPPKYRHLTEAEMPIFNASDIKVKIISGEYEGLKGTVELYKPVNFFDVNLSGGSFNAQLKDTNLVYVHSGRVTINGDEVLEVEQGNLCLITDVSEIKVSGNGGFLFLSANAINEPIARYGPFVMNTMDEIIQAVDDFNNI
jgi:quercetin 2,3-dioxygenase